MPSLRYLSEVFNSYLMKMEKTCVLFEGRNFHVFIHSGIDTYFSHIFRRKKMFSLHLSLKSGYLMSTSEEAKNIIHSDL